MAKLYFRYAAMNAGKSTALLQAAHNYEERGMQVRLFTAALDDRDGVGVIASRLGLSRQAQAFGVDTVFDAPALWGDAGAQPPACLLIDEAQFLTPDQVQQLHRLVHREHIPVLCWGLRSDFRGQAFAGSAELLTLADDLEELKTVCACGRKASMNLRMGADGERVTDGEQVLIGGPRCFYSDVDDAVKAPGLFG
jgi:thymidine kinase